MERRLPVGRWVATGSWAGSGVKIWNLESKQLAHELPLRRDASVAFSPDGKWLVTSESESIIWQVGTWSLMARFPRHGYTSVPGPIAFTPDGTLLAVASAEPPAHLLLIDMNRLECIATLESPDVQLMPESIAFAPDGTQLLFPDPKKGHVLHAWDLRAIREQLATMNLDWDLPPFPPALPSEAVEPLRVEVDLGELAPL